MHLLLKNKSNWFFQVYKEHFINQQKSNNADMTCIFSNRRDTFKDTIANTHLPANVTYGPSPFGNVQSAVGKAISNAFNRSQQLPGN